MSEEQQNSNRVEGEYGAEQIEYKSDLDHVRSRPGMYIGDTGIRGLHHLVYEAVDNSIDEVMAGHATHIEVAVHADIPHQEVLFLDTLDAASTPLKAKGVGELGVCGVAAAIANAAYNATGVRVRDYPITLERMIDRLPEV